MNSRILTIAALLMVGAALGATPVLAAGGAMPGNRGSAEKPVNRDAPFTLPAAIAPKPTPIVDTASLNRGLFDQDPAAALAGLATVTLSHDGSVSETDASEALRGILETEIKGHQK